MPNTPPVKIVQTGETEKMIVAAADASARISVKEFLTVLRTILIKVRVIKPVIAACAPIKAPCTAGIFKSRLRRNMAISSITTVEGVATPSKADSAPAIPAQR